MMENIDNIIEKNDYVKILYFFQVMVLKIKVFFIQC